MNSFLLRQVGVRIRSFRVTQVCDANSMNVLTRSEKVTVVTIYSVIITATILGFIASTIVGRL